MKCRKNYFYFVLMLVLLSCTGCNGSSNDQESEAVYSTEGSGNENSETEKILLQPHQWQQGFLEMASMSSQETLYYDMRRRDIQQPEMDFSYVERQDIDAYAWDARYVLTSARVQGDERYILSRQTSDLTESEQVEILNDWENGPHGYAVYMDIVKEDTIAVLFAESSSGWKGQITGYDLLTLDSEGKLLSVQSMTDAYQELGISVDMGISGWWCNAEGYQYLLLDQGARLVVIDAQGKLARDKILIPEEELYETAFHMPDGNLVFSKSVFPKAGTELIWMEFPGGTEHVLWECSGISMDQFTVTPEGILYYTEGSHLYSWNLQTGQKQLLFRFLGTDISPDSRFQTCYLTVSGEHELIIYVLEMGKSMALTDTPPETEDDITCVALAGGNFIRTRAAVFSREHEGVFIKYTSYSYGDWRTEWIRLSAEVAAGNGPDIMVVDREQMQALQAIGALEPLDDYLKEESIGTMFSGIRKSCNIDGKMYGIIPEGAVMTFATSFDLWPKDSWTIQDILEIMDSNELEGMFYNSVGESSPGLNLLSFFDFTTESGNIPFCDLESGESHFESEEFQHLLEVCKRYGEKKNGTKENILKLMAEGKILAVDQFFYDMSYYTEFRAEYDGKVHFVGNPEQTEGVGVFSSSYYVVVNKEAKNKEVIAEFLNYLLSTEAQSTVDLSVVTSAALEDLVEYYEYNSGEIHYYIKTGRGRRELKMKEDGSSYMPDYIDFVNQLGVSQGRAEIWEIVEQEAEDYWNGSKSAEDVALIIDNRVQLYLDEHR